MIEKEIWGKIPIENHLYTYEISNFGNINYSRVLTGNNSRKGTKILKIKQSCIGTHGYKYITISIKNKPTKITLHRLLALTFIQNPDNKPHINHKDGNKLNNSLSNLEWCTHQENMIHAHKTGLNKGYKKPILCITTGKKYASLKEASVALDINHGNISAQLKGNNRKSVGGFKFQYL